MKNMDMRIFFNKEKVKKSENVILIQGFTSFQFFLVKKKGGQPC